MTHNYCCCKDPCLWSPNLCENVEIFKDLRENILFHLLWEKIFGKIFPKIFKWGKSGSSDKMFDKYFEMGQVAKSFPRAAKSGENSSRPPLPSVLNTNHCAAHTQRSKLIEGSGQPWSHRVNVLPADTWRKLVKRAQKKKQTGVVRRARGKRGLCLPTAQKAATREETLVQNYPTLVR